MKKIALFLFLICCFGCAEKVSKTFSVNVKNTLDKERTFETVEVDISDVELNGKSLEVVNAETNTVLISQIIDLDGNGTQDLLLFQPEVSANSEILFNVNIVNSEEKNDSTLIRCYSRFVPERTDDYAWENNRVAFRTFGPVAQKMVEDSVKGGTLSSGIDAWLKRVEYPIINKWYKKHTTEKGSYHEDTGEGLDNFHVGVSRGVGGTAVKMDSVYAVSKNFINWKTITNGPIRTAFVLEYESYDANGSTIKETKHIALDYGQNLSHYNIKIEGTDRLSAGLTLHNNDGKTTASTIEGWMSYWEPYFDSELGQGLVVTYPERLLRFDKYETNAKDKSNFYAQIAVSEGEIDYYAGFGWKKSGQFNNQKTWEDYLSDFANKLKNPLIVTKQ